MYNSNIGKRISEIAISYKGLEELPNNSGFKDRWFESHMRKMGWKKFQSWCAYFVELVWREAYKTKNIDIDKELNSLFSASAVQTYKNFDKANYHITLRPEVGALAVWQKVHNGKYDWRGHIGVVIKKHGDFFTSIEGNTNNNGSRNGYKVAEKIHQISIEKNRNDGLKFIGFVYPKFITIEEIRKSKAFYA